MYGLTRVWFGAVKILNNIKKIQAFGCFYVESFLLSSGYVLSPKAASAGCPITGDN